MKRLALVTLHPPDESRRGATLTLSRVAQDGGLPRGQGRPRARPLPPAGEGGFTLLPVGEKGRDEGSSRHRPERLLALALAALALLAGPALGANARDHYQAGRERLAARNYIKAEVEFRQALELNPYYTEAWLALGDLTAAVGRYRDSVEACSAAAALDPFSIPAGLGWGRALYELGDDSGAEAQFTRVLQLDPAHREARLFLARIEHRRGRVVPALRLLAALESVHPQYADLYLERGLIQRDQRDLASARASFQRAWELDNGLLEAGTLYAARLLGDGGFAAADTLYAQVLARDPAREAAARGRAWCAFWSDQPLPAEVKDRLGGYRSAVSAYFLGYAAWRAGDTESAIAALGTALNRQDNDNLARLLLAGLARSAYRADHLQRKRLGSWHLDRARHYATGGEILLARYHFEQAVGLSPQDGRARYEYGAWLDRQGFAGPAVRQLNAAVELDRHRNEYRDLHTRVAYNQGRSLAARYGLDPTALPAPAVARVALFLSVTPLDAALHPGVVELLGRKLAGVLEQNAKFAVVYRHPASRELNLETAESIAAGQDAQLIVFLQVAESDTGAQLDGSFIVVPDGYRSTRLHLGSEGNWWSDIVARQLAVALDRAVAARGELVQLDERGAVANLGAAHSLKTGDRVVVGARAETMKVTEVNETLARLVPENLELLRRVSLGDAVVTVRQ